MSTPQLGDRSLFPSLTARSYLAHCGISPVSAPVRAAVLSLLDGYAAEGMGALPRWMEQRAGLRERLARLIGGEPETIGLVANTTSGVVAIANTYPWKRGDRVVVFDGEFPTNVTPWLQAAATYDLAPLRLPLDGFGLGRGPTGDGLTRLEAALRTGVRLVAVSAVQFQTGLAMPLTEIGALCRRHGAELFVDAIQAVGVVPVDVVASGIDYLACGSHKWLMGIEGCGFVYVSPARAPHLVPRLAGWLSHVDPVGFLFKGPGLLSYDRPIRAQADAFESGVLNGAGYAALDASLGLIEALGVPAIRDHVQRWHDRIEPALFEMGFTSLRAAHADGRSGILALRPPAAADPYPLVAPLKAQGIVASAPDGCLRLAPHWPNALEEVPFVLAAVRSALASIG